jgi:PadR family transcriptional regulator AphA
MVTGIVNLRTFILGLLALKPMSGYDVKRFLKGLSWLIGSPSPGSLYPILRTLLQEGRVTVETIPGVDRPPRKIYTITRAGRRELETWLDQPAGAQAPLKSFVMRLLLSDHYAPGVLCRHLGRRRDQVAMQKTSLLTMTQALDGSQEAGQHLALEYGLALANAELAWLDSALVTLVQSEGGEEN